ncbi:MAG: hypothetical protein IPI46_07935 [Bacteroidetes bacterium]|nr:hypothetical protein [Bacteroidota bacterium]
MEKSNKIDDNILQLWRNAEARNLTLNLGNNYLKNGNYQNEKSGNGKIKIPQKIIVVSHNLFKDLNASEKKIVLKIIPELKTNNAFWLFNYREKKGRDERAILMLRKKKILLNTGYPQLHIVNPFALRNGSLPNVIACTSKLSKKRLNGINFTQLITNQRPPENYSIDELGYDEMATFDKSLADPFFK